MKTIIGILAGLVAAASAQATNNAAFVSQSVPTTMTPGQTYAVSVTLQNTGNTTWTAGAGYKLASQNPENNVVWGFAGVPVPGNIAPGQNVTFSFNVTAPATAGVYNFQWRMVQDFVEWFGAQSPNVLVAVGEVDFAQFVSQSVPTHVTANQPTAVSVTMKNAGSLTWSPGTYYLRSQNPQDNTSWGLSRVELAAPVAHGQQVTFSFNISRPVGGTTNFQWRMAQGTTSFGDFTPNTPVGVLATNNAAFVSQSVPTAMTPGQTYPVSVTLQNTGNTTWSAGPGYKLATQNPENNVTWGFAGVPVPGNVAPGQNVTFSFNVTAPATAGMYNFQWKMVQDFVEWFGAQTPNVAIAVGAVNHAHFVSQSVPTSMNASQSHAVSITMRNAGGTTWNPGTHYLRSQSPQDNTTFGLNRVELPSAVAPGQNVTFSFNATPPVNTVTQFQWRMAEGTTNFGELTSSVTVQVNGTNNAAFVSQNVPAAMNAGQSYAVSVTMQNTGTNTWSAGPGYKLASQNPENNVTWGFAGVPVPGNVAPGQNVTFGFNVTAPATPGAYNFQWKMVRDFVEWFGAQSPNVAVNVQPAAQEAKLHFIHTDHLNTPRLVANQSGQTVWRWDQQEPFGVNVPDENPSGLGAFDLPLRLPGQYFDKETNLYYNYYRDYDPAIGRYAQSDPIGLNGGLNTYAYVANNPLVYIDPSGLVNWKGNFGGGGYAKGAGGAVFVFDLTSECKCNQRVRIIGYASGLNVGVAYRPGSTTVGSTQFYDYRDCPDPGIANGLFTMASAGFVIGVGPTYARIQLGGLRSYGDFDERGYGYDVSIGLYLGASTVTSTTIECCN